VKKLTGFDIRMLLGVTGGPAGPTTTKWTILRLDHRRDPRGARVDKLPKKVDYELLG